MYDDDMGGASFARKEGGVQGARDERPQGAAGVGVVLKYAADEDGSLGDGRRESDDAVGVELALRAQIRREERHERADVGKAGGVVLDATAEGGEIVDRALAPVEETFQAFSEAELLLGRNGDSASIGIHDHARVRDAL